MVGGVLATAVYQIHQYLFADPLVNNARACMQLTLVAVRAFSLFDAEMIVHTGTVCRSGRCRVSHALSADGVVQQTLPTTNRAHKDAVTFDEKHDIPKHQHRCMRTWAGSNVHEPVVLQAPLHLRQAPESLRQ